MKRVLQGSIYKEETLILTRHSLKWELRSAFLEQPTEVVLSSEILWKWNQTADFH